MTAAAHPETNKLHIYNPFIIDNIAHEFQTNKKIIESSENADQVILAPNYKKLEIIKDFFFRLFNASEKPKWLKL